MNIALVSRVLIALLFVVAGIQKLNDFSGAIKAIAGLGVPAASLVALIVIIIEIPVAIAFAVGYRVCMTGITLIAYTALVTVLVHGNLQGLNLIMALKNIAIIGGILGLASMCTCGKCPMSMCGNCKNGKCDTHKK